MTTPQTEASADNSGELSQDIRAAVALIKAHPEPKVIAAELRGSPVYQVAYTAGHSDGGKAKTRTLGADVQLLTDRAERAETLLAEAMANKPDLAARDAAWQKKLELKEAEARTERERAQKLRANVIGEKVENALSGKLRKKYAHLLAPQLAARVRAKDDGSEELLGDGDIPVQVPQGRTIYDVLADEAVRDADPEDVIADVDRGAGVRSGGGTTTPGRAVQASAMDRKRATGIYNRL